LPFDNARSTDSSTRHAPLAVTPGQMIKGRN
jgi:hypothetical protein